jgi:GNAT superfamily N-acetyltransferase
MFSGWSGLRFRPALLTLVSLDPHPLLRMNGTIVRTARPDEFDRVRAVYLEWGYGGGVETSDLVFLAESAEELLGLVRRTLEGGTVMLRGMRVAPEARGQGVGTTLLKEFVAALGEQECYCIPYTHLIDFYGREGFTVRSSEMAPDFLADRLVKYQESGFDVVIMHRAARS